MTGHFHNFEPDAGAAGAAVLHFTPAEWRSLLKDGSFLKEPDNSIHPRRLMGLEVRIVPDHRFG